MIGKIERVMVICLILQCEMSVSGIHNDVVSSGKSVSEEESVLRSRRYAVQLCKE